MLWDDDNLDRGISSRYTNIRSGTRHTHTHTQPVAHQWTVWPSRIYKRLARSRKTVRGGAVEMIAHSACNHGLRQLIFEHLYPYLCRRTRRSHCRWELVKQRRVRYLGTVTGAKYSVADRQYTWVVQLSDNFTVSKWTTFFQLEHYWLCPRLAKK